MSLTTCLNRNRKALEAAGLSPEDIRTAAQAYRLEEERDPQDAALTAVADALAEVMTQREALAAHVAEQGGVLPSAPTTPTAPPVEAVTMLADEVSRLTGGHGQIEVRQGVMTATLADGREVELNGENLGNLVRVSLAYGTDNAMEAVRHESIHVLRAMGIISEADWQILSRQADKTWMSEFKIPVQYAHLEQEQQIEEAVARAFEKRSPGAKGVWGKMQRFFARLGSALRGQGWRTAEDVLDDIDSGAMASQIEDVNIEIDGSLSPAHSLRTWNEDAKNKVREWNAKKKAFLPAELEEYMDTLDNIRAIVVKNSKLHFEASDLYDPIKPNSDAHYEYSMDFSTLCRKRVIMQATMEAIQVKLERPLNTEEFLEVRQALRARGYPVSCGACYVETKRMRRGERVQKIIDAHPEIPNEKFLSQEGFDWLRDNYSSDSEIVEGDLEVTIKVKGRTRAYAKKSFPRGATPEANAAALKEARAWKSEKTKALRARGMKAKDYDASEKIRGGFLEARVHIKGKDDIVERFKRGKTSGAAASEKAGRWMRDNDPYRELVSLGNVFGKANESRTEYTNEIFKLFGGSLTKIKKFNEHSGMRWQSWSDFELVHALDAMQGILDMSVMGMAGHAYTKVGEFVEVLGHTGMMTNMSVMPAGDTGLKKDGTLDIDDTEGMPWAQAMELRNSFPRTAGTIIIGVSDEHIRAAMAHPQIDFIIPYHHSGLGLPIRQKLGMDWTDYTAAQEETVKDEAVAMKAGAKRKKKEETREARLKREAAGKPFVQQWEWNIDKVKPQPAQYWDVTKSGKENAEEYLRLCDERGLYPVFDEFSAEEGYWKTLIDRKMYDNEGAGIEQRPVKPIFNEEAIGKLLEEYEGDTIMVEGERVKIEPEAVPEVVKEFTEGPMPRRVFKVEVAEPKHSIRDERGVHPNDVPVGDWAGRVMFHGATPKDVRDIIDGGIDMSKSTKGYFGRGFYMASERALAESNYQDMEDAEDGDTGVVILRIKPDARILDLRDPDDYQVFMDTGLGNDMGRDDVDRQMVRRGIDGLFDNSFDGVVIYNPNAVEVNPQHSIRQTETPEFKAWFGDSKVVDAEGKPLVVYHGTGRSFDEFLDGRIGTGADRETPTSPGGFWFTGDQKYADIYAKSPTIHDQHKAEYGEGGNIMPVYLSMENPAVIAPYEPLTIWDYKQEIDRAITAGHDGVIFLPSTSRVKLADSPPRKALSKILEEGETKEDVDWGYMFSSAPIGEFIKEGLASGYDATDADFVAFSPTQIKSATGNVGTFNPADPDIRHSIRDSYPPPSRVLVGGEELDTTGRAFETPADGGIIYWEIEDGRLVPSDNPSSEFYYESFEEAKEILGDDLWEFGDELAKKRFETESPVEAGLARGDLGAIETFRSPANERDYREMRGRNPNAYPAWMTIDGFMFFELPDGTVADSVDPDRVDMSFDSVEEMLDAFKQDDIDVYQFGNDLDDLRKQREADRMGEVLDSFYKWRAAPTDIELYTEALRKQREEQKGKPEIKGERVVPFRKPRPLFQDTKSRKRGRITFGEQTVISLFEGRDLSTVLHEGGHFFLQTQRELAQVPGIPAEFKADYQATLEWLGAPDGNLTVEHHEKFARGFEAYLREGRAPAVQLHGIFRSFKSWLMRVYKDAKSLNAPISDQMRGVFDRMLATDEQIEIARDTTIFRPDKLVMELMTKAERQAYVRRSENDVEKAKERMLKKALREEERKAKKWWKAERAKVREEVAREVEGERVYQALHYLRTGTLLNQDDPEGLTPAKLSRKDIVRRYSKFVADAMPRGIFGKNPVVPEVIAEQFGFASAAKMLHEFAEARPIKTVIDERTDAAMIDRHGDMLNDGTIELRAMESMQHDDRGSRIAYELEVISRHTTGQKVVRDQFKETAKAMLAGKTVDEGIKPAKYYDAELRAARASGKALGQKNYELAAEWKAKQLLNHYLYRESMAQRDQVAKTLKRFNKYLRPLKRGKVRMDEDYHDMIGQILARYELGPKGKKWRQDQLTLEALQTWQAKKEQDDQVEFIQMDMDMAEQIQDKTHYRDMTMEEFQVLSDIVDNLAEVGRLKRTVLVEGRRQNLQEVATQAKDSIEESTTARPVKHQTSGALDQWMTQVGSYFASTIKARTFILKLDGYKDLGLIHRLMMSQIDEAEVNKVNRLQAVAEAMEEIYQRVYGKRMAGLKELQNKVWIQEIDGELTREGIVAFGLNWGNLDNRAKLLEGHGWTEAQGRAIMSHLTTEDAAFINEAWQYIDSFWPEIAALEKRSSGVTPEKVKAAPFTLSIDGEVVEMRGGYYPIAGDPLLSPDTPDPESMQMADLMKSGRFSTAQTARGHTKERKSRAKHVIRLDLNPLYQHVNQVVTDLTMREAIESSYRILTHGDVKGAVHGALGPNGYKMLDLWLKDLAAGNARAGGGFDKWLDSWRAGVSVSVMGFKASTTLVQLTGFSHTLVKLGPKYTMIGLTHILGQATPAQANRNAWMAFEKSKILKNRSTTFHRDIFDTMRIMQKKGVIRGSIAKAGFWPIVKMQMAVDIPTWIGAYYKGLDEFNDEAKAVEFADSLLLQAQSSGYQKDLSAIERGTTGENTRLQSSIRLWTTFYSYFNAKINLAYQSAGRTDFKKPGDIARLGADYVVLFWLEAAIGEIILGRMPDFDGDDEDKSAAWWNVKLALSNLAASLPGVREIGGVMQGFGGAPGGLRGFEAAPRALQELGKLATDDDVNWNKVARSLNSASGIIFKHPAAQINQVLRAMEKASKGEDVSPAEYLLYRPPTGR